MKKKILKSFLLAMLTSCYSTITPQVDQSQSPSIENSPETIAAQREMLESIIAEVRSQTNMLGSCIQRILQAIQYDKVKHSEQEKMLATKTYQEFLHLTQILLKNLMQINPSHIQNALIHNIALTKYLLRSVKTNILAVHDKEFQTFLDKEYNNFDPNDLDMILHTNNYNLEELSKLSDTIGLSWYNKGYKFLKKKGAYSLLKNGALISATAYGMYVGYRMMNPTQPDTEGQSDIWKKMSEFMSPVTTPVKNFINPVVQPIADFARPVTEPINDYVFSPACNAASAVGGAISSGTDTLIGTREEGFVNEFGDKVITKHASGLHKYGAAGALVSSWLAKDLYDELKPFATIKKTYTPWINSAKLNTAKALNTLDEFGEGTPNNKLFFGEYENINFKDMTGAQDLENLAHKIANFMKHPERYERAQIEEHRGILLYGPAQTGKTLFAKALRTVIQEAFGSDQKMHFLDVNAMMDINNWTVEYCFYIAQQNTPCILFFDEIDLTGGHREKSPISTKQLLAGMQGIDSNKQIIVIGATNKPEQIDNALLVDGRFGKKIYIDYPKYTDRKAFLEKQVAKRSIAINPEFIDHVAQETEGCSYNNLKRIIDEAMIHSDLELQPVSEKHFEQALDTEIRKIKPVNTMPDSEKKVVATYQAGKALMRHILETKNQVVKVTINNVEKNIKVMDMIAIKTDKDSDNDKIAEHQKDQKIKYGEVFTKALTDHFDLVSDTDLEHECLSLLAGGAALKLMYDKTFTSCNPQDRAEAMKIIYSFISQGEKADQKMTERALVLKNQYEEKVSQLLTTHKETLEKIITKLLEQNTIDRYEWAQLVQ